jgi:hypothetical protein
MLINAPVLPTSPATAGEDLMRRRTILASLTALAAGITVAPAVQLEANRQGMAAAMGILPGVDDWDAIVAAYAHDYYAATPDDLVSDLSADLVVLQHVIAADPESRDLRRTAAQLGAIMALILGATGKRRAAQRWWGTARDAATVSGDPATMALVRGKALVRGLYEGRSVITLLDQDADPITVHPCAGQLERLAGRAQGYAMLGQADAAHATLRELNDTYEHLPNLAGSDVGIFGWSESNTHHTGSYVYTHLGETSQAYAAQDHALALYPPSATVPRAMVQLHRARCLIIDGDLVGGVTMGADALDSVPAVRRGGPVGTLAQSILDALPAGERNRPTAGELRQRLV